MLLGWFVSCLCEHALGCGRTCCCGFPLGINGWNPYLTVPNLVSPNKGRSQKGEQKRVNILMSLSLGKAEMWNPRKERENGFYYGDAILWKMLRCCPGEELWVMTVMGLGRKVNSEEGLTICCVCPVPRFSPLQSSQGLCETWGLYGFPPRAPHMVGLNKWFWAKWQEINPKLAETNI